jgi:acyl carrier protein
LVLQADVADQAQMEEAVRHACQRFGTIHGVVHAAGVPGGGVIQLKKEQAAASVLSPKVRGVRVLEAALRDVPIDWLVLCSSLTAITGGLGQVDYCAANAFMDAYAQASNAHDDRTTVAINWDAWAEVGMLVDMSQSYTAGRPQQVALIANELVRRNLADAILPEEGVRVFQRILSRNRSPQVVVATRDLATLIEQTSAFATAVATAVATASTTGFEQALLKGAGGITAPGERHPRPALATDYVKPRNEIERAVAEIWAGLLGVERVGIDDSFFELGGDSLIGIQVVAETNREFKANLQPVILYEKPTVRAVAASLVPGENGTGALEDRRGRGERRRARKQQRNLAT